MDRWHVYSYLKNRNGAVYTDELKREFEWMGKREMREGIREYNLMAHRCDIFEPTEARV